MASVAAALLLLVACSTPAPPPRLYHLPTALPPGLVPSTAAATAQVPGRGDTAELWQLVGSIAVPDYLSREALVIREGQTGLRPLDGHRWAEPLRDALPRVLRADLAALVGEDRVVAGALPPGTVATRQLRVEILGFEAAADRRSVQLRARWTLVDPRVGATAGALVSAQQADISVQATGGDADALAAAHRLAIWRLARRIAGVPDL